MLIACMVSLNRSKRRQLLRHLNADDGVAKIGLAVDVGSSSVRCSAYLLRPDNVTFVPGSMRQVSPCSIHYMYVNTCMGRIPSSSFNHPLSSRSREMPSDQMEQQMLKPY